ncbi:MAG: hypothetical protein JNM00_01380, partial [Flavobacteriales bacterium]|nr:hypothetical protein [Flavobacteriales bacterium]
MKTFVLLILLAASLPVHTQILTSDPPFPTQDDVITIYYNTTSGNGDLAGVIPVYAHTGVISNYSDGPNDWQHVQGNWGTADPNVIMTYTGTPNVFSIEIQPSTFYGLNVDEEVTQLMFVFRNQAGTLVGRNADGSDIYFNIYPPGFNASIQQPGTNSQLADIGETVTIQCGASSAADLSLSVIGSEMSSAADATSLSYDFSSGVSGEFLIEFTADNGIETITDQVTIIVLPSVNTAASPPGTTDGINYLSSTSVRLQLYAPNKDYIFVLGDMTGWAFDLDYMMNRTPDGNTWWVDIDGLVPGQEYRFQYYIGDEGMRVAEIYADKILDPWNDPWISEETYPGLTEYPTGLTTEPVSVLQTDQPEFSWTDGSYQRPPKERLVVYELLVRDFTSARNYQTMLDTLDYLDSLNVSAIQLMPINEFEGNDSWGYNPSFYFAPDKAYGSEEALKTFINACHERGIAVVMDIALNHSFGQNPMVRMYFDADSDACNDPYGAPTPDNPWFNECAKHSFNVGYDFNHESQRTRDFCKRVFEYWLEEYHIDGFRLDLSKGFTQNNTFGNLSAWADYDQSRINILTDYYNHMQSVEPGAYVILEHFADNDEEQVLAGNGMLLWGNLNYEFNEASMGYTSNLSWGSYQARGWGQPHLVTYAESHDEERLNYKNQEFGNISGSYNIQQLATACARQEMVHALLIPLPGPKMIWQFGELGYDYSINYCPEDGTIDEACRTYAKPVRWDYYNEEPRYRLYKVVGALNHLKQTYATFSTDSYTYDVGGSGKRLILNHDDMNSVVVGNFGMGSINMIPGFQHTGTWYDYFTGNAIEVNDLNASFAYAAGEYHVYTDEPLPVPQIETGIDESGDPLAHNLMLWPNPANNEVNVMAFQTAESITVHDAYGQLIFRQNGLNSRLVQLQTESWP